MKLHFAYRVAGAVVQIFKSARLFRSPTSGKNIIKINSRFDQRMQERRANPTHIYHGLHQTHLKAGEPAPKEYVTPLNMHKRFIKKMLERRAKKWTSWRDAYEAEKRTNDWPVWSASQLEKISRIEREIEEAYQQRVRDAEYAALLERQAKERAELVAELERTRPARARALADAEIAKTDKEFLYSLPPLPRDEAH